MDYRSARYRGRFTDLRVALVDDVVTSLKARNVLAATQAFRQFANEMLSTGFNVSDMLRGVANLASFPIDVFLHSLPYKLTVTVVAMTKLARENLSSKMFDVWYEAARVAMQRIAKMMDLKPLGALLTLNSYSLLKSTQSFLQARRNIQTKREDVEHFFSKLFTEMHGDKMSERFRKEFVEGAVKGYYAGAAASTVLNFVISFAILSGASRLMRRVFDRSDFDALISAFVLAKSNTITLSDAIMDTVPYQSLRTALEARPR